ncbi:UPF0182 family membrane protein [Natronospora cellulosivora (SeqCode)]
MKKSTKILIFIIALVFISVLIFFSSGTKVYTDWLWFQNLDLSGTFYTMFFTNFILRIIIGFIFAGFIYLNLSFTRKPLLSFLQIKKEDNVESIFTNQNDSILKYLDKSKLNYIFIFASVILGFLFSSNRPDLWEIVLKYINQTPFEFVDPIFGKDIAFYVFSLPLFNYIREIILVLVVITLIVITSLYILASGINSLQDLKFKLTTRAKAHMTTLVTLFLLLKAWDYRLSMYNLLYSTDGVVFGAGYTDINANLLGLRILFVLVILIAIILLINLFRKSYTLIVWCLGFWLLASIVFGGIYPGIIQHYRVRPNERNMESEYISHNIEMTLKAYNLHNIEERSFDVDNNLTADDLIDNQETIDNIRLWDPRPLSDTYNQRQALRQRHRFPDIDVDRYYINGEYRQVMLGAREIDQTRAQTWVNQRLKFTHGYGIAMSPVNEVTTDGMPKFFINDIPVQSHVDLLLENPAIYYGEMTNDYVIANTNEGEFHYPTGSENIEIHYTGTGGVEINNIFRKAIFGLRFGDINFLLSNDINNDSRVMYYRNIHERVRKAAPFLRYDNDPYMVLADGRLFYIQDAYTTTNRFPYSQPTPGLGNYIRNSIKVIIDAYNGTMDYYIVDKNDPIAMTYKKIFPDLFIDGDEMPEELRNHLRYPEDLFIIQHKIYERYHMKDPGVFYDDEDLWARPSERYGDRSIIMSPYYTMMKLPGFEGLEFVLMLPYTIDGRDNMIAWMAGRSDGDHHGELVLYQFPTDRIIDGPMQIETRIDQNPDISRELSLWSTQGSRVIRGNLLVIPIESSILYIEPLYMQAETSEIPQLNRVIVVFNDMVIMRRTLEEALFDIFGEGDTVQPIPEEYMSEELIRSDIEEVPSQIQELISDAMSYYKLAQEKLKDGNWSEYGEYIQELEKVLNKLNEMQ